jgi:hypothetical protein
MVQPAPSTVHQDTRRATVNHMADIVRCAPCAADASLTDAGFWQCPVCATRVDPDTDHGTPPDLSGNLTGWAQPPAPAAPTGGRAGDPSTVPADGNATHATVTVGVVESAAGVHTPGE